MKTMNIAGNHLISQLDWPYAAKQFDPARKISPEDWAAIEEALLLSPSSFGGQPWKIVVVTDQAVKERLVEASRGQRPPADCSHHVVFAIKKGLGAGDVETVVDRMATVGNTSHASLAGYRDRMLDFVTNSKNGDINHWAARQAYIALGNFLTSAALLGIDVCPMEGIDRARYDAMLGLDKQGLNTVVAAAAGYRAASDKCAALRDVRFPKDAVLLRVLVRGARAAR
jgi:nitroreductase